MRTWVLAFTTAWDGVSWQAGPSIHPAAALLHRELAEPMDSNKGHPGARHSLPSKGEKHVFTMNSVLKNSQTWCLLAGRQWRIGT